MAGLGWTEIAVIVAVVIAVVLLVRLRKTS